MSKFSKTGLTDGTPGRGEKLTQCPGWNIRVIANKIKTDLFKLIRQLARESRMSKRSARQICGDYLMVKSRAQVKKQLINVISKDKSLKKCKNLINILKDGKLVIMFSDKKVFNLDSVFYNHINCYLSSKKFKDVPEHVKFKFQTKHLQSMMAFGVLASDSKKNVIFFVILQAPRSMLTGS